jgi:diadenosine hexaphosphate hydrolase (ATP-forming)
MKREYSSGGIVIDKNQVLVINMNTICGKKVWTFPKGHIEKNEDPKNAALREVLEETGVECRIINEKEFYISEYSFYRGKNFIHKTVRWYLMKPVRITEKIATPDEINEIKWLSFNEALNILEYKSDKEIIEKIIKHGVVNGI